jgi:hypothetical protein
VTRATISRWVRVGSTDDMSWPARNPFAASGGAQQTAISGVTCADGLRLTGSRNRRTLAPSLNQTQRKRGGKDDEPRVRSRHAGRAGVSGRCPGDDGRRLLAGGGLRAIKPRFAELLADPDSLPAEYQAAAEEGGMGRGIGQWLLYRAEDGSLSLASLVVPPGSETPIHDHLA